MTLTRQSDISTAARPKSVSVETVDRERLHSYEVKTYTTHLVLSVIAIVCCGVFFGVVALIYAVKASRIGGPAAERHGNISLILSGIGIVVGIIVGLIVGLAVGLKNDEPDILPVRSTTASSSLYVGCDSPQISGSDGNCYNYELFASDPTTCTRYSGYYDVHSRICYYNNDIPVDDVPTTTTQSAGDAIPTPTPSTDVQPTTTMSLPPPIDGGCTSGQIYGPDGQCYNYKEPSTQNTCDTLPGGYYDDTTGTCYYNNAPPTNV